MSRFVLRPSVTGGVGRRWIFALAMFASVVSAVGCGTRADSGGERVAQSRQGLRAAAGSDAGSSQGAAGSAAGLSERQRIQAAMDAWYAQSDVQHTFETQYGEVIDCLDYYAQPGVKALIAAGKPVPSPSPKVQGAAAQRDALPDFMFNGKPDRLGRPRSCPDGAVPIPRITVDDVMAAGGLAAARSAFSHKRPPPHDGRLDPCAGAETGHGHVTQNFNGNGSTSITTTTSTTSIYSPKVTKTGQFSLSQTWTYTGHGFNICGETCTTDCSQTVEAGWVVYPDLFPTAPADPHLFTYATSDGYKTGCWNNDPRGSCIPFIVDPQAGLAAGAILPTSVRGGTQKELTIQVTHSAANGWCLRAGVVPSLLPVGCWPNSDFSGSMQTSASTFQVGAEIASGNSIDYFIPMGSGAVPSTGYQQAAYHRDYSANGSTGFKPGLFLDHLSYGMAIAAPAGGSWANWFYFGSEPLTGWTAHSFALNN